MAKSEWKYLEKIFPTNPVFGQELYRLSVDRSKKDRRIYLYNECLPNVAGNPFRLECQITGKLQQQPVFTISADLADLSIAPYASDAESAASLANGGGAPVGDSLVLYLAQPFGASSVTAVCQPVRFEAEIDELVFSASPKGVNSIQMWRFYLACLSQE